MQDYFLGVLFMCFGVGALLGGVMTAFLQRFLPLRVPLLLGSLLLGFSTFLTAPVTHKGTLFSSVLFLYTSGLLLPTISISIVPVVLQALEPEFEGRELALKDYVNAINFFTTSSGIFVGPIIGSELTTAIGFRATTTILGAVISLFAVVHYFATRTLEPTKTEVDIAKEEK